MSTELCLSPALIIDRILLAKPGAKADLSLFSRRNSRACCSKVPRPRPSPKWNSSQRFSPWCKPIGLGWKIWDIDISTNKMELRLWQIRHQWTTAAQLIITNNLGNSWKIRHSRKKKGKTHHQTSPNRLSTRLPQGIPRRWPTWTAQSSHFRWPAWSPAPAKARSAGAAAAHRRRRWERNGNRTAEERCRDRRDHRDLRKMKAP